MRAGFLSVICFTYILIFSAMKGRAQEDYFQQEVNYTIRVSLDDVRHELDAYEEIQYINHSKHDLSFLYFHIWPNAYKNNSTDLAKQLLENGETVMYYADEKDLGYIDSLNFKINGEDIKWEIDTKHIDICKLYLNKPLKEGDSIRITTPFHVKLPSAGISRLGHIGQAYMITQWFPKPAVFDLNGWNAMPYLNQGEFYSEFGSFDVSITLPKNYLLAATGDRIDAPEEEQFLEQKFEETKEKIRQFEKSQYNLEPSFFSMEFPPSSPETKTVRFKQYKVHDFAWFADKRFNVLQGEVTLPKSQRDVKTWAFFTNGNLPLWKDSRAYLNDATFFYSLWNGDYQYNHVTAIDGTISAGGGMEYPNITVIGNSRNAFELESVIMHEVGHNWFYGMLGSNERVHGWMDEGINSFNELRYIKTKYPSATIGTGFGLDSTSRLFGQNKFKHAQQYELFYKYMACRNLDQPCELHSRDYTEINYGAIMYSKTAILFNYLMNYMGEDDFDRAMQFYFNHFKFKHPQPRDLKKTLEYFSGKDLSWFFDDLIGSTKKLDYKISNVKKNNEGQYEVTIKNCSDILGPVAVCGLHKGEIRMMLWLDGFEGQRKVTCPPAEVDEFRIDYFQFMPDINRKNNSCQTKGIFRKAEPLHFPLLAALDDPYQSQLFWSPVAGYNEYNGVMAGLALYNHATFQKKFEFELMPLYGFQNKDLAGYANFRINYLAKNVFQQITWGAKTARFSFSQEPLNRNFNKIAPFIDFTLRKGCARCPIDQHIIYRAIGIFRDDFTYAHDFGWGSAPVIDRHDYIVNDLTYTLKNKRTINPFSLTANVQAAEHMSKASVTATYNISIRNNKAFEFRLFAGKMFSNKGIMDARFRMSGQTGMQDYMYDHVYFGRSAASPDIGFQQFTETDGAFKVWSPVGQSDDWILALNFKTPRPYRIPLYAFADIGLYHSNGLQVKGKNASSELLFSAGLAVPVVKDILEVYVPLLNSKNITDAQQLNGINRFIDTVRFTFYLNRANPFEIIKNNLPF